MATAPTTRFESILVISTRQLGDVLLTTPLIHAARERWPEARIDVLGFKGTLGLLAGNPDVGRLIEVPPGSGWKQSWPLIKSLWRRYDLALIAQYSDRAHLYGLIAARQRSGLVLKKRSLSWWKRLMLVHAVTVDVDQTHAVIEKVKLIEPWADVKEVSVRPPAGSSLPADVFEELRPPYVVLQIPSLVAYKQWPLQHAAELARALIADDLQVVLSGSGSTLDREKVGEVMAMLNASAPKAIASISNDSRDADPTPQPAVLDVAGRLDLQQVTTLLQGAALYIGPDTSITHLAAACGTPMIALFGPISPTLWGPWPQGAMPVQPYVPNRLRQPLGTMTLLQGTPPCVPCNRAGCDNHNESRSECLETMLPERVLAEARALLAETASGEETRTAPRSEWSFP
ncbi:glycosyltransferase family 9 protein [soil metagenome]